MSVVDLVKVYWRESYGDYILSEAYGVKVKCCFDGLVCLLLTSSTSSYKQDKWAQPMNLPKKQCSFRNGGSVGYKSTVT